MATYHVFEGVLICSSKDTTSDTAAAVWATTWFGLWSSTVILQDPSGYRKGQTGEMNGDIMKTTHLHPLRFQGQMNFCHFSWDAILWLRWKRW